MHDGFRPQAIPYAEALETGLELEAKPGKQAVLPVPGLQKAVSGCLLKSQHVAHFRDPLA